MWNFVGEKICISPISKPAEGVATVALLMNHDALLQELI
jgi:hypothetical protein